MIFTQGWVINIKTAQNLSGGNLKRNAAIDLSRAFG